MFFCKACGNEFEKWNGRCPVCGEWGSLEEISFSKENAGKGNFYSNTPPSMTLISGFRTKKISRIKTHLSEFNRVVGGGIFPSSVTLLAGEPGIGKSTLMLSICEEVSKGYKVSYFSGEESGEQLSEKLFRIGGTGERILFSPETNLSKILTHIKLEKPDFMVIDSFQTISNNDGLSTISFFRNSVSEIVRSVKENNVSAFLIGHFTKSGDVAGPKLLEHMVDTVLTFSGEKNSDIRILKPKKNRFGSTDEVGFFRFSGSNFEEVKNPSEVFYDSEVKKPIGTTFSLVPEGARVFLVDIETLAVKTSFGFPKRLAEGISQKRFEILLAALSKSGVPEVNYHDVYIKTKGGFRITDTFSDLAIVLSIYSAVKSKKLPENKSFIGELSLNGIISLPRDMEKRLKEARKYGINENVINKKTFLYDLLEEL